MNNTQTLSAHATDLFSKTNVPKSVRSMTLDLVIPAAGFAIGIALFGSCWKLGLWHSAIGIAFATVFLIALPVVALGRTAIDATRGKAGTQTDFVLFATVGYLATYLFGVLSI